LRRLLLVLCLCFFLAACQTSTPEPNNARNPPTLPAPPTFREAHETITLNNIANIQYLGRLDQPGTLSTLFTYALSPDTTRLVGLNNEELLGWDLLTGKLLLETSRGGATRIFYASDKTEVYGVDSTGQTSVFDTNNGAQKTSFLGSPNYANVVEFSPDAGWLALGGNDGTVKVWDTYVRQSLVTINADEQPITSLAFSQDGETLATAGNDGIIRAWHWRDRTMLAEHKLPASINAILLAFAPDGSSLAIGTNRDARLWSLTDTTQAPVLETGSGGAGQILRFSPDGRYLLAGSRTAGLSLWNITDGVLAARLPDTRGENISAAFSPDGTLLVTSVLNGKIALWNLVQITSETINQSTLDVGTPRILYVDWTDDGRLLMFFDSTGPVYLWGIPG